MNAECKVAMQDRKHVALLCTVRNCGLRLRSVDRAFQCEAGHAFDVARSGYVNLLQPGDRRSRTPGDSREAVLARRRLSDAGHNDRLRDGILREAGRALSARYASVLDAGCGEGFHLGSIASLIEVEAHGVDISVAAIDLAARKYKTAVWAVANADRFLPYSSATFDLVLSVTARHSAAEFSRVLSPTGTLIVVVPGPDDLIELRETVQGEAIGRDRVESVIASYSRWFTLEAKERIETKRRLSAGALRDVLVSTYRGARRSQRERIERLQEMEVTISHDLFRFKALRRS